MSESLEDKARISSRAPGAAAAKARPALLQCVDTSVLKDGVGAQISLGDDNEVSIGRDDKNHFRLLAQGVSRFHARVFYENGAWLVNDLGSTNGTRVNNSKINEEHSLRHGDTVAFGRACYKFRLLGATNDGASTGLDIDLGASAETQTLKAISAANGDAANSRARARAGAKTAAASKHGDSNAVLWAVVIAAFAALVLGGAKLLGFF